MAHPRPESTGVPAPFPSINRAYNAVFRLGELTLGVVVPIESYPTSSIPTMDRHVDRVQLVEKLGFAAIWLRDVPFQVPAFGDAGQTFDPFVYLGLLAGQTERLALGVASIILPLRHPAHVAKAAASVDALTEGRLILGVASGDRPEEYPALHQSFPDRGARFRESYDYIRHVVESFPTFENQFGKISGDVDMLPKPASGRLPLLITGASRQDPDWLARHGDGWMIYPRSPDAQGQVIADWRGRTEAAGKNPKPVMQPLYVDLTEDPDARPRPIHLGFRLGARSLVSLLDALEAAGVNHVALNLRFNEADIDETLHRLAESVLPQFAHPEET